jgi:hypothetical protein
MELARVSTEKLTIELKHTIKFHYASRGGTVTWKASQFDKWISFVDDAGKPKQPDKDRSDLFSVTYCVAPDGSAEADTCSASFVQGKKLWEAQAAVSWRREGT